MLIIPYAIFNWKKFRWHNCDNSMYQLTCFRLKVFPDEQNCLTGIRVDSNLEVTSFSGKVGKLGFRLVSGNT